MVAWVKKRSDKKRFSNSPACWVAPWEIRFTKAEELSKIRRFCRAGMARMMHYWKSVRTQNGAKQTRISLEANQDQRSHDVARDQTSTCSE